MGGLTFPLLALVLLNQPVAVEEGTHLTYSRKFDLPVRFDSEEKVNLQRLRLFVSRDKGRTWKLQEEILPATRQFSVLAADDGLYWFALQFAYKNGDLDPPTKNLTPNQKVHVNAERRIAKTSGTWSFPPREPLTDAERSEESLREEEEIMREVLAHTQMRIMLFEFFGVDTEEARRLARSIGKRVAELETRRKKARD